MKIYQIVFAILLTLFSCTPSAEETSNQANSGIHFLSKDGIKPMGLIKKDGNYQLFYSSQDSWYLVNSPDMIHWDSPRIVDIPSSSIGDVVSDELNDSNLGNSESSPILLLYNQSGIKAKYSVDNGTSWSESDIEIEEVSGNPKIVRDIPNGRWIMSVTNDDQVSILTSPNLTRWKKITELELNESYPSNIVGSLSNGWFLISSGENTTFQLLDADFSQTGKIKDLLLNQATVSYNQVEGRNIVTSVIGNSLLTIPFDLALDESSIAISKINELNSIAETKRRSKISSLKGQGTSRFQFELEPFVTEAEINVFNDQGESLKILFSNPQQSIVIDQTQSSNSHKGIKTKYDWSYRGKAISIDLLIDYSSIELIINQETSLTFPVNPVFVYDQVNVAVDNKKEDARGILYTLKKKTGLSEPNI